MTIKDGMAAQDACAAGLVARPSMGEECEVIGYYDVECVGADGEVKWVDRAWNVVTTQGKNNILDVYLGKVAAHAEVRMGLHTTVGNAASTYASAAPQVETTSYDQASRPSPSWSAAASGAKSTSSAVAFTMNATVTVTGCFIVLGAAGVATKGDTATAGAILYSSGAFGASRGVVSGDTLNVSYTSTLT